jgi:hypothetical protein
MTAGISVAGLLIIIEHEWKNTTFTTKMRQERVLDSGNAAWYERISFRNGERHEF